jgi:solute carrier family 35 protein E3
MLPLAIMMCLNILCLNLSLTFSSITFYQIARILLTPAVAAINFLFYKMKIPKAAVAILIPMCLGVAITSCFEPKSSTASAEPHSTDVLGVVLAFGGVLVSAVYLVWIAAYQRRLEINAFQLLYNQAPIGGLLLLCFVPWTDSIPTDMPRPAGIGTMICLSAICAVLINISQFYVTMGAGPVSSTVAGHFKTCSIIVLGWIKAGQRITDRSMFGISLAVGSIFL